MMMAVRVIVMIMRMFMHMVGPHFAAAIGHHAQHMLELDGGVMNAQAAAYLGELFKNRLTFGMRHIVNQHM